MKKKKIVRTPTSAEGGLTPEEEQKMKAHVAMWIARAMRTDPIEPDKIVPAIKSLYANTGLPEPRVVIVPSPRIMAFAGGFASAIWWLRSNPQSELLTAAAADSATSIATVAAIYATYAATQEAIYATYAATQEATYAAIYATYAATQAATDATSNAIREAIDAATDAAIYATYAATREATQAATDAATDAATYAATINATDNATYAAIYATYAATQAATDATSNAIREAIDAATDAAIFAATNKPGLSILVRFFLDCARRWTTVYQGGNMWAASDCFMTAARDILHLELPEHKTYAAWEQCTIHGGFRWMHEKFCIVSDFPELLKVDEHNRPHCDDGPSHRWRDGWELYHIHGVRVSRQIVMNPESITIDQVRQEKNAEVRRVMIERMGWDRFCSEAKLRVIHTDTLESNFPSIPVSETVHANMRAVTGYRAGKETAELLESDEFRDFDDQPLKFVRITDPSTGEKYTLRVWAHNKRAYEAVAQTFGMTEKEYRGVYAHS